jgi:uncharacterized membrane protein
MNQLDVSAKRKNTVSMRKVHYFEKTNKQVLLSLKCCQIRDGMNETTTKFGNAL